MTEQRPVARPRNAEISRVAAEIRRRALDSAISTNGAYLTQACGIAEVLATLYVALLDLGPSVAPPQPEPFDSVPRVGRAGTWGGRYHGAPDPTRDRFIVSPAHYALAIYGALTAVGRLDERALEMYGKDGSVLEMIGAEHSPGMELTSGSLAQSLSVALGEALVRQRRGDSGRIWVLISDGELQEGQTWEALQVAAHYRLTNLTLLIDANGFQVDGPVESVITVDPIVDKLRSFGWDASEVDGHDPEALITAAQARHDERPRAIVCRTTPWKGLPSLQARHPRRLHFVRFAPGEADAAIRDLIGEDSIPALVESIAG